MESSCRHRIACSILACHAWVVFLGCVTTFAMACSVDVAKLRAISKHPPDGAIDFPTIDGRGIAESADSADSASDATPPTDTIDDTLLAVTPDAIVPDAGRPADAIVAIPDTRAPEDSALDSVDANVDSAVVFPVIDPDLVLWYKFDEGNGTTAMDSALWGGAARNATLATSGVGGTASFSSPGKVGSHAIGLTSSTSMYNPVGGYVSLPSLQTLAPSALTIAVWVHLPTNTNGQSWARVFDIGTGTGVYMFLTVRAQNDVNNPVRFAITKQGNGTEQRLDSPSALIANEWHHLAVVLQAGATYTGTLYLDGQAVGTNKSMTLHPSDLGATTNNWLGRSQYTGNNFLNGSLDDFRVYRRALSQSEIAALMTYQ